ncbi:polyprenyl synthetase family protein [Companilactobacillus sp.]|jgi:heptaprenyl diphosphate synthase|uniref:polyprenyl synthetase family protein n=3 Tax=Companilactobacillus sp. TaxID=2767905 RepID=UPI0025C5B6F1|nr:polyprenyl synthetase family protein [Companilactobacillus sp.]MCH4009261.1 polyprenyl synthetase family protein [Companilactobacillus sp.]MCH4050560.1 polyprenyl synthetase family protein [Companilactobacillus sp.]MCH4077203.1 polyprenyl synthetase family protein [Companilactobacillus sp.]MCH4125779.1 polyprenyl synthetase family protein [Companilactobacillus sp.]MCI1311488.1 polyprenyl synthetase family protein [Companilactobacillus sp.]
MPAVSPFEQFQKLNVQLVGLEDYMRHLLELHNDDIIQEAGGYLHSARFLHAAFFYLFSEFGDADSEDLRDNSLQSAAAAMQMFYIRNEMMRKHQAGPDSIKLNFMVEYFSDLIDVEFRKCSADDDDLQGKIDAVQEITTNQLLADEQMVKPAEDVGEYIKRIEARSAVMFEFACRFGAQATHANDVLVDSAGQIGRTIGLAYQIKSEIFDLIGINTTEDQFGPLQMLQSGEFTLPTIFAVAKAGPDFMNNIAEAGRAGDEQLIETAEYIIDNGVDAAQVMVKEYRDQAVFDIDMLPNIQAKSDLKKLVDMLL